MERNSNDALDEAIRRERNGQNPTASASVPLHEVMSDPGAKALWAAAMIALQAYAVHLEGLGVSRFDIGLHVSGLPMRMVLDALGVE